MISILDSDFAKQPWFIIICLLAIFGVIVIAVILVRKYSKFFKSDEKPKSDKEIAEEEVNRLVVDVDDKTQEEMNEAAKKMDEEIKKESAPSEKEVASEEVSRHTEEIEDDATLKAMEEYAKAHPEEAENASNNASQKEDK